MLEDNESEKKFGFKLSASLNQAAKSPLLKGYKVTATKKCIPPPQELKGEASWCPSWRPEVDSLNKNVLAFQRQVIKARPHENQNTPTYLGTLALMTCLSKARTLSFKELALGAYTKKTLQVCNYGSI